MTARPWFILVYALAYTGTWLALLTPVLVTIALRVRQIDPVTPTSSQALVLAVGALFALIGNPLFGRLSDRTTSAFGMRRPWLVGGMLGGALALLAMVYADSIGLLVVAWCLAQLAFNAVLAAIVAILPDQIPPEQRGTVAGILGICLPLGQAGGTFLVKTVAESTLLSFMLPAGIGFLAVALLALLLPDRRLDPGRVVPSGLLEFARSFWIDPRRHPDFAWAWLSRFLLVTGTAFLTTYQPFYLMDKLGYATRDVPDLIFRATLLQAALIVASSILSGRWSDALGRRRIFVLVAAAMYGVALWIIAGADSYEIFLAGMALSGIGQGVYFAVDLALITQILPNRERDAAKDLGIFNIANALPQSVAPALAPLVLAASGGSYAALFATAGTIALAGSVAILQLRTVK